MMKDFLDYIAEKESARSTIYDGGHHVLHKGKRIGEVYPIGGGEYGHHHDGKDFGGEGWSSHKSAVKAVVDDHAMHIRKPVHMKDIKVVKGKSDVREGMVVGGNPHKDCVYCGEKVRPGPNEHKHMMKHAEEGLVTHYGREHKYFGQGPGRHIYRSTSKGAAAAKARMEARRAELQQESVGGGNHDEKTWNAERVAHGLHKHFFMKAVEFGKEAATRRVGPPGFQRLRPEDEAKYRGLHKHAASYSQLSYHLQRGDKDGAKSQWRTMSDKAKQHAPKELHDYLNEGYEHHGYDIIGLPKPGVRHNKPLATEHGHVVLSTGHSTAHSAALQLRDAKRGWSQNHTDIYIRETPPKEKRHPLEDKYPTTTKLVGEQRLPMEHDLDRKMRDAARLHKLHHDMAMEASRRGDSVAMNHHLVTAARYQATHTKHYQALHGKALED